MKEFTPKLFSVLKNYSGAQLVKDIVAGIIVAIIALPLSIALAIASGVGPEAGIYTAIVAGFIVSFLGGSRVQIAGPTAAFATIVAGIVLKDGKEGLIIATIMAGVILIIMGLCRFGSLLKYIPDPITTGFTAGIAVTLFIGQIKDFTGISYMNGEKPIETGEKIMALIKNAATVNVQSVLIGALALIILCLSQKFLKKIPGSFIAVIVTAAIVEIFHLDVNTIGTQFENIQAGLPPVSINLSMFTFASFRAQLTNAVTIAFLAGVESLLSAVVADSMIGSKHKPNMELVAQGVGNIASACLGGIPATGAIARTAANIKNGGRTPVAGMVHSVSLLLVVVFLMPLAKLIPMPCIAAILFQVAYNMSGWRRFVKLVKSSPKSDIVVLVITFVLTVVFDLVVAIEVGVLLADGVPVGLVNVGSVVGALVVEGERVLERQAVLARGVYALEDLGGRADDDELGAPAFALDAGVGCKRRRKRHVLGQVQHVLGQGVERVADADREVLFGGEALALCQHLGGHGVVDDRVSVGAASVDSDSDHSCSF